MSDARNLRRRLDVAYDTFDRYRRPMVLDASPLRDPDKLLKKLTAKPLKLLDGEDVQEYASAALTTVGTVDDYKHFLPRLIDLATQSGIIEPPTISLKLKKAQWRAWPKNEQQALEAIFLYSCLEAFKKHTDEYLAGGWLVSLAILNMDLGQLRAEVANSDNDRCALQLADLLLSSTIFASNPSERAYWEDVSDKTLQETRCWLLSEATRTFLITVRLRTRPEDAWLLEKAISRQEELIQQRHH
jgi:hypothetical protein